MKLVKFKDGKYGIRGLWIFSWRFADLEDIGFYRYSNDYFFSKCKGTKNQCLKIINSAKHEVIDCE